MLQASHNPKEDNGYKVYWSNGAQITSPHDVEISKHILANLAPWEQAWDNAYVASHSKCSDPLAVTKAKYLSDLKAVVRGGVPAEADQVSIVYTAMVSESVEQAGACSSASLPPSLPPSPSPSPSLSLSRSLSRSPALPLSPTSLLPRSVLLRCGVADTCTSNTNDAATFNSTVSGIKQSRMPLLPLD